MKMRTLLALVRFLRAQESTDAPDDSMETPVGRLIFDRHRKLGNFDSDQVEIDVSIRKEAQARRILFDPQTPSGLFFEIGGGDGELSYLLGIVENFQIDEAERQKNRRLFDEKFEYRGNDLASNTDKRIFGGDICSPTFLADAGCSADSAAVVYSNNVFEHLKRPWIAAENAYRILKPGGVCITVVPFAQRYHNSPGDYFRYTHTGIASLFESAGPIEILSSGYDLTGRRKNWQGGGRAQDIVPVDAFGAWRETWYTFFAFRKPVVGV